MDNNEKGAIYERLLAIKVAIDPDPNPTPNYINSKIWECHRYIEEVERYHILISREMSIIQQALNNSQAEYQAKKEALFGTEEIRILPSIRDREAQANQKLKEEQERIKGYQNSVNDLNNLLRAVDLKLKNLNRLNGDIRLQVRILESQLKINGLPKTDPALRGLAEEMGRSLSNTDSFMDAESSTETEVVADPTAPLDLTDILSKGPDDLAVLPEPSETTKPPVTEMPLDNLLQQASDPIPELDPEKAAEEDSATDDEEAAAEAVKYEDDVYPWGEGPQQNGESAEAASQTVDLDLVLMPEEGKATPEVQEPVKEQPAEPEPVKEQPAEPVKEHPIEQPVERPKEEPSPTPDTNADQKGQQQKLSIDLDGLLDDLFPNIK